jgi:hypothetical protein
VTKPKMFLSEGRCVYIDSCSSVSFFFQNSQTCYVEVWDRPWLQLREVTNVTCNPTSEVTATEQARSKRVCIALQYKHFT